MSTITNLSWHFFWYLLGDFYWDLSAMLLRHLMAVLPGHLDRSLHRDLLAQFSWHCSAMVVRHLHWHTVTSLLGHIMTLLHWFLNWHLMALLMWNFVALLVVPIA